MAHKKIALCLSALACAVLFTACQPLREIRTYPLQNSVYRAATNRTTPALQQLEDTLGEHVERFDQQQKQMQARITYLEDELLNISGIDSINVVIIDHAAIVSVGLEDTVSKAGITYLREAISQQVKRLDSDIRYVTVTVSPELVELLDELSEPVADALPEVTNTRDTISNFRPVV